MLAAKGVYGGIQHHLTLPSLETCPHSPENTGLPLAWPRDGGGMKPCTPSPHTSSPKVARTSILAPQGGPEGCE
jgi:hypothetical protein